MFFKKETDYRVRMYNREFPWLWSICSDWRGPDHEIRVLEFREETFGFWLPDSVTQETVFCYFHTLDAVIKIHIIGNPRVTIGDAFVRLYSLRGGWRQILHMAVVVEEEGIRIYRPRKGVTFQDLYQSYALSRLI
ncbi:MAG: hypothetical protein Q8R40_05850 [bacterium]|nr:hypothetical protein [bacterium]